MADLVAGDVTYTMVEKRNLGNSKKANLVQLAFGDGTDTVPSGGIPLTKAKMGCPVTIESLKVVDQGSSGYVFNYDASEEKLIVLQAGYDGTVAGVLVEGSAVAIAAQTLQCEIIGW